VNPELILGRQPELNAIQGFFASSRSGPRALLLEGEAGIGKTILWREAMGVARSGGSVLQCRASEAEAAVSFAVLGDLLSPVIEERLELLPAAQRDAIEAALLLGSSDRSPTGPRAVSLAVLGVLRLLAADGPVTIAIDDVQWTDRPSARTLAFALRRLDDEPIAVVATIREGRGLTDPIGLARAFSDHLTRITVGPIAIATLGRVLRDRLDRDFAPPLVKRIHETSGGNAFFGLEIGRAIVREDRDLAPGEPLPVPPDLQDLLRQRLSSLSDAANGALLLASATASPTAATVERAGGERSGLEEAEEAGIAEVRGGTIEFSHPLLASTVYLSATSRARSEAHRRLAEIAADTEERARHLALATDQPDETVARALEEAALEAQDRGAPSAAAELNLLAARATPAADSEALGTRRHRAMGNLFAAGDVAAARGLAERMIADLGEGHERARTLYSLACMTVNDMTRSENLLTQALSEASGDDSLSAEIQAEMAWTSLWMCDATSAIRWADSAIDIAERLEGRRNVGNPLTEGGTVRIALSARSMATCVLGQDTTDVLVEAVSKEAQLDYSDTGTLRTCLGWQQMWAGALDAARETLGVELDRYIEEGHETASWEVRTILAELELRAGRWEHAARHAQEAQEIAEEAGWNEALGQILATKAAVEAARGSQEAAREDGLRALSLSERMGARWDEIQARSALGFLELSLGDHASARAWLDPLVGLTEEMGIREPGAFPFVPDEIEALVGLGELERAEALTDRLEEHGTTLDRGLALATAARCRGLIAAARGDREAALRDLYEALERHARVEQPFEIGRTLLVLGEVQRRFKQRRDAGASLEAAGAIFDELGAPLWSARAEAAAARLGRVVPSGSLTSTEKDVAALVATGKTNREIGDALFLSVKTVEANVSRILAKLGVSSRRQVAGLLEKVVDPPPDDHPLHGNGDRSEDPV
jgi:DNA-binding CsgD family transcriptional regulator